MRPPLLGLGMGMGMDIAPLFGSVTGATAPYASFFHGGAGVNFRARKSTKVRTFGSR
jgi:hypothetical protein